MTFTEYYAIWLCMLYQPISAMDCREATCLFVDILSHANCFGSFIIHLGIVMELIF